MSASVEVKDWHRFHAGNTRPDGGGMSRFRGTSKTHARITEERASLRPDHPALAESLSIFQRGIRDPEDWDHVLVSGHNSPKTGKRIVKGPWAGMPVYTLTLEERATCPTTCGLLASCYGNTMPFAARYRHGEALEMRLAENLDDLHWKHGRFAVRLHILGDFYDLEYVRLWQCAMDALPGLHVWGYTHHDRGSQIGRRLQQLNDAHPTRWAIRFSVAPGVARGPMQATTIWRAPEGKVVAEGQVCPAQTEATTCCGTCGLCWSAEMRDTPIVFLGHGMSGGRKRA